MGPNLGPSRVHPDPAKLDPDADAEEGSGSNLIPARHGTGGDGDGGDGAYDDAQVGTRLIIINMEIL
jgi:hypothetical protein